MICPAACRHMKKLVYWIAFRQNIGNVMYTVLFFTKNKCNTGIAKLESKPVRPSVSCFYWRTLRPYPSVNPSVYPSVHPFVLLSVRQFVLLVRMSVRLPESLSVRLFVSSSISLSLRSSVRPSVHVRPPVHPFRPFVLPSLRPSVRPSVHPSVRPSVHY